MSAGAMYKSPIKKLIENEILEIINSNKELFNVIGANKAGDKIIIPLKQELTEEDVDNLSRDISFKITLHFDKLRKEGKIVDLPILTFNTNPKMISIEI